VATIERSDDIAHLPKEPTVPRDTLEPVPLVKRGSLFVDGVDHEETRRYILDGSGNLFQGVHE
jgi:hypothetical protein